MKCLAFDSSQLDLSINTVLRIGLSETIQKTRRFERKANLAPPPLVSSILMNKT
jgi:hypothetical protein